MSWCCFGTLGCRACYLLRDLAMLQMEQGITLNQPFRYCSTLRNEGSFQRADLCYQHWRASRPTYYTLNVSSELRSTVCLCIWNGFCFYMYYCAFVCTLVYHTHACFSPASFYVCRKKGLWQRSLKCFLKFSTEFSTAILLWSDCWDILSPPANISNMTLTSVRSNPSKLFVFNLKAPFRELAQKTFWMSLQSTTKGDQYFSDYRGSPLCFFSDGS